MEVGVVVARSGEVGATRRGTPRWGSSSCLGKHARQA